MIEHVADTAYEMSSEVKIQYPLLLEVASGGVSVALWRSYRSKVL